MKCPTCGEPLDVVPYEALVVRRVSVTETPIVVHPEPTKCSRCDYPPSDLESGLYLNT
jgi:hypothetical protein